MVFPRYTPKPPVEKILMKRLIAALVFIALASSDAGAGTHHKKPADSNTPGSFDFYVLSLSWSPEHCKEVSSDHSAQCTVGSKLGFVLHGLWPQYNVGWPHNCSDDPLPADAWTSYPDVFPSEKLMQHEWATHGTCSGLSVPDFFALSKQLKTSITIPGAYTAPAGNLKATQDAMVAAFMTANSGLASGSVVAACSPKQHGWLQEMHLCFDKTGKSMACSADETKSTQSSCPAAGFKILAPR
jgi:ribonuclease T2